MRKWLRRAHAWPLKVLIWVLTPVVAFALSLLDPDVSRGVRILRLCIAALVAGVVIAALVVLL